MDKKDIIDIKLLTRTLLIISLVVVVLIVSLLRILLVFLALFCLSGAGVVAYTYAMGLNDYPIMKTSLAIAGICTSIWILLHQKDL